MLIKWAQSAEDDLLSLLKYLIESGGDKLAENTARRLIKAVERLKMFPSSGRIGVMENTRELVVPDLPYTIVYKVGENVKIIRVIHTSRLWEM